MPKKPFPKYEDWEAPWDKEGAEEFDEDRAKRLLYNLEKGLHNAKASRDSETARAEAAEEKVQEYEDKELSETDRLRKENERLKSGKSDKNAEGSDDLTVARLEIALEKGLTARQAKRLVGKTRDELEDDADALLEEIGAAKGGSGDGDGDDDGDGYGDIPDYNPDSFNRQAQQQNQNYSRPTGRLRGDLSGGSRGRNQQLSPGKPEELADALIPRKF